MFDQKISQDKLTGKSLEPYCVAQKQTHQGILNYFDGAENAFISAYRHHPNNDTEFEIKVDYFAAPSLKDKTLIIADPMLATGKSMVTVYEAIKKFGNPKKIHIVSVIVVLARQNRKCADR